MPLFIAPYTVSTLTPDNNVTITRMQVQLGIAPAKCSTNAQLKISDGTTTQTLTLTGTGNDTGPLSVNYAAGANVALSIVGASHCAVWPAVGTVLVQYKTH